MGIDRANVKNTHIHVNTIDRKAHATLIKKKLGIGQHEEGISPDQRYRRVAGLRS